MKNYLAVLAAMLTAGLFSSGSTAAELNITGNVVAFPCQVDPDSVNKTVNLGRVSHSGLSEANSGHTWTAFDIKVVNCPDTISSLTATFTGNPAGSANNLFANQGTAQNVAVQMAQRDNQSIILGNMSTMTVNVANDKSVTFALVGRPYSEQGGAVSGTLNSVVQVNFSYP